MVSTAVVLVRGSRQRIDELAREGIRSGYIEPRYYVPLFQTIEEHFSAEWLRVAREALERGDSPDNIVIASRSKDDGSPEIVGWCQYGAYDNVPECFGPFGVVWGRYEVTRSSPSGRRDEAFEAGDLAVECYQIEGVKMGILIRGSHPKKNE